MSRFSRRSWLPVSAGLALAVALAATAVPAMGQDLQSFAKKTTVKVLPNGWTFIIVERPVAPVFSFATFANVGSVREVPGITGLAHMFEHMAFKGTPDIGTTNWPAEKKALAAEEVAYQAYNRARLEARPDEKKVQALEEEFKKKQAEAEKYVVKNEFGDIIEREGGVGLNAFTSDDVTGYFYSLPANKVELFAYLESERFLHPVFREFYKERSVVQEERRLRTESQPIGRLVEQFLATAFIAHPYHHPTVGWMSDLDSFTMTDAKHFFNEYYVPSNLVTAIVGDVKANEVIPVIEKYFGRIPARPAPPALRTVEPPQTAQKTVILHDPSQPIYLEGYHKGAETGPDQPVFDAIDDILSRGRTSRLYRDLVRDKKLAVAVQSFSSFPGEEYPNLWGVFAVPAKGITNQQVADEIHEQLELLKDEPVSAEELAKFKTRAKADLVRSLDSNSGLAQELASYQTIFGDWRELFRYIDRLDKVTPADIQRVAKKTFVATNRTVGEIVTQKAAGESDASGKGETSAGAAQ